MDTQAYNDDEKRIAALFVIRPEPPNPSLAAWYGLLTLAVILGSLCVVWSVIELGRLRG